MCTHGTWQALWGSDRHLLVMLEFRLGSVTWSEFISDLFMFGLVKILSDKVVKCTVLILITL